MSAVKHNSLMIEPAACQPVMVEDNGELTKQLNQLTDLIGAMQG